MTAYDMDLYAPMAEADDDAGDRVCGTCANCCELCCGRCACLLEADEAMPGGARAEDALAWASDHMRDMQAEACGRWEACGL